MTKLILVRHGQTEWNIDGRYQGQTDVPLSADGVRQAQLLADHFPLEKVDAIYSSDLNRAMVTAGYIAQRFGIQVQPEPAFRELSFGAWEGLSYEEIVSGWPEAMKDFLKHPDRLEIPNGESFPHLQDRAMARLREIIKVHEGGRVVIVAHGAILRTILCSALHMSLAHVWTIRQFNTALNVVCYDGDWSSVELMNSTAHLGDAKIVEKMPYWLW